MEPRCVNRGSNGKDAVRKGITLLQWSRGALTAEATLPGKFVPCCKLQWSRGALTAEASTGRGICAIVRGLQWSRGALTAEADQPGRFCCSNHRFNGAAVR